MGSSWFTITLTWRAGFTRYHENNEELIRIARARSIGRTWESSAPARRGNPLSLIVNSDTTLSAIFEPMPQTPTIAFRMDGNGLVIEWSGGGVLQAADHIIGPWADLSGSTRPVTIDNLDASKFYRVKQ